jgi:ribonucleoside-diphosphate reductase alpha chain
MPLSQNAIYLLNQRYCKNGESPENVFKRTAEFLSKGNTKLEERFYDAMINGIFLPNSPALFNAGFKDAQLMACFILKVDDDTASIFKTVSDMARVFKTGGGVGINFSPLREKDAIVHGGGTSSGTLSFMGVFDNIVEVVKQGGMRRGALMGILNYTHPEIFDFIKVKLEKKLQNFNLSIMVDDSFMNKVLDGGDIDIVSPLGYKINTVKAKDIFELMAFASWVNGDPALLFFDRINKDNPFYPDIKLDTTNPCSEVSLPPYGACCLGSINLSKFIWKNDFNFERFANVVKMGMTILTNMNELSTFPLPEITECMREYNPVGLGIMGFADCLIKLGIRYDSQECLDFIDKLGTVYKEATLAYNPDKFYFYRRIIAPTGSLSILADCSSGIEPVYDVAFQRSLTIGKIEETRDLYKSEYVRTAHQVSPEWHIKVLAKWQEYIDGGASKTVNVPYTASVDDIKNAYITAWKAGVKGVTIYRDGSRNQVLTSTSNTNKFTQPKQFFGKCNDGECTL